MDSRYAILCFEQAAQPAFNRVARDRAQVEDAHVTNLLRYLAMHLFDPDFSVRGAQRRLRIKDNNFSTVFGRQIGETPALYSFRTHLPSFWTQKKAIISLTKCAVRGDTPRTALAPLTLAARIDVRTKS